MMQGPEVAAVVPAYNEEKTVGDVVRTLVASGRFSQVVVVSDGSTDGTARAAREAGASMVRETAQNRGKGGALSHGLMHTDAPVVCFFDADLIGLTSAHIDLLLAPLMDGGRYMNVGLRDRGNFITSLTSRLPLISGERALRRVIFEMIPGKYMEGFKVEAALNYFCKANGLAYGSVALPGLKMVRKMRKIGVLGGLWQYAAMILQVSWSMIEVRLARRQFIERGTHMSHRHL